MSGLSRLALPLALAGTLLLGSVSGLRAQDTRQPAAPQAALEPRSIGVVNKWLVRYYDNRLGVVTGTAVIDWRSRSTAITFTKPGGDQKFIIGGEVIPAEDGSAGVTMRLRGKSPSADAVTPPSTQSAKRVTAAAGDKIEITTANPSFSAPVKDRATAQADVVSVNLREGSYGALIGEWSYLADPLTKRDRNGSGRSGYFRFLNSGEIDGPHEGFLGEVSGGEIWSPLPPRIFKTVVLEEQLALRDKHPAYPYPFAPRSNLTAEGNLTGRTLFIVGINLPLRGNQLLAPIEGMNDLDDYRVLATSTGEVDAKYKDRFEQGWKLVLDTLPPELRAEARHRFDAALVGVTLSGAPRTIGRGDTAHIAHGAPSVAGWRWYEWGGASDHWFLQFGDNIAEARIVRQTKFQRPNEPDSVDEFEVTPNVFLPETLRIEIQTRVALPLETIPVKIARGKDPAVTQSLTAKRVGDAGDCTSYCLYRTEPFGIAKTGSGLVLQSGDELMATVQVDDVQFIAPPFARANVLLTPDEFLPQGGARPQIGGSTEKQVANQRALHVKLWREAVLLAALVDGVDTEKVAASIDDKTPGAYQDKLIARLAGHGLDPYRDIPVTVADHAAMLLLRSTFLDLLEQERKRVEAIQSDDDVDGFRQWLAPFLAAGRAVPERRREAPVGWEKYPDYLAVIDDANELIDFFKRALVELPGAVWTELSGRGWDQFGKGTYFGDLPVSGPGGGTWPFGATYTIDREGNVVSDRAGDKSEPFFHGDMAARRAWQRKATREVLAAYLKSMKDTISGISEIDLSDRKELLKLTSVGFDPVVNRLIPNLMKLDQAGQWIADGVARQAVGNLHIYGQAVRAAEDYRSLKFQAAIQIASAFLMLEGPGLILNQAAAVSFTSVANYGLLSLQAGETIYDQVVVRREIDRFFGAAGVLGRDRLDEALLRKLGLGQIIVQIAVEHGVQKLFEVSADEFKHIALDNAPIRLRSLDDRIRAGLDNVWVETALPAIRKTGQAMRNGPPIVLQRVLELATRAAGRNEARAALSAGEVEALRQMNLLAHAPEAAPNAATALPEFNDETVVPDHRADAMTQLPGWLRLGELATKAMTAAKTQKPEWLELAELAKTASEEKTIAEGPPAAVAITPEHPRTGAPSEKNSWLKITEADGKEVYYKTEGSKFLERAKRYGLDEGVSSAVYGVADVRFGNKAILEGDGVVLKVVMDSEDFGTAQEQMARMKTAYDNLKAAKERFSRIEFPEIEFHPDANPPYMLQRRLRWNENLVQVDLDRVLNGRFPKPFGEVANAFPEGMQRSVLQLYKDLAESGLMSPDLSLKNIYFKKSGSDWICGVLDIDHIVHNQRKFAQERITRDWLARILFGENRLVWMSSRAEDGRKINTTPRFMEKALEMPMGGNRRHGWIYFNDRTGEYEPTFINLDLIPEYFPEFRRSLRPPPEKRTWLDQVRPLLKQFADCACRARTGMGVPAAMAA